MIPRLLGFVSGLSGRAKVLFYGAAAAVLIVALDLVVWGPIKTQLTDLDTKTNREKKNIQYAMNILKQKEDILKELGKYAEQLKPPAAAAVVTLGISDFVNDLARRLNLATSQVKPMEPEDESLTRRYKVRLTCQAEMLEVLMFIHQLEGSERMFEVERWTIESKPKGSSTVECTMVIAKLVILGG
jgi:hypothetical protein